MRALEQEAGEGRKEGEGGRKGKEEKEKGKEKKKRREEEKEKGAPAEFAATVDHARRSATRSATRGARKKRDGAVIELRCRDGENRREGFREFRISEKI